MTFKSNASKALSVLAFGLAMLVSATPCAAQTTTFVVPYGAGGKTIYCTDSSNGRILTAQMDAPGVSAQSRPS